MEHRITRWLDQLVADANLFQRKVWEMTYEKGFKEKTIHLSNEIGVKNAAEQLGDFFHNVVALAVQAKVLQQPCLCRQRPQADVC